MQICGKQVHSLQVCTKGNLWLRDLYPDSNKLYILIKIGTLLSQIDRLDGSYFWPILCVTLLLCNYAIKIKSNNIAK